MSDWFDPKQIAESMGMGVPLYELHSLYEPDEARKTLPLVSQIASDIKAGFERITQLSQETSDDPEESEAIKSELDGLKDAVLDYMNELDAMNIAITDLNRGSVGFPSVSGPQGDEGRSGYYTWEPGDEDLDWVDSE